MRLMFFRFRRDLKHLQSFLESGALDKTVSHQVIKIKRLKDIAPATIKGRGKYIEEYELYVWLLSEKRSRKLKKYFPQLFEALSKAQCIRNYFHLAHTAATGEENPDPSNWNLQNLPNKELAEKFLDPKYSFIGLSKYYLLLGNGIMLFNSSSNSSTHSCESL